MTDTQLYLVIGVPIVTNLLGFTLVGISRQEAARQESLFEETTV